MAEPPESMDFSEDVALLKRMTPMASRVHVVAADALLSQFNALSQGEGDEIEKRILAVRLVAEAMSALEDFGALCRAVRKREEGGIISNYLKYSPGDISEVFREIVEGSFGWNYLRLYVPMKFVNNEDQADEENPVLDLDVIIGSSAKWQQVTGMIELYNSVKHGFRVLDDSSLDMENAEGGPTLYLLTRDSEAEPLKLNKLWDWPERAKMVIQTCAEGWKQLADLVCFMHDNNYGVKLTEPPST